MSLASFRPPLYLITLARLATSIPPLFGCRSSSWQIKSGARIVRTSHHPRQSSSAKLLTHPAHSILTVHGRVRAPGTFAAPGQPRSDESCRNVNLYDTVNRSNHELYGMHCIHRTVQRCTIIIATLHAEIYRLFNIPSITTGCKVGTKNVYWLKFYIHWLIFAVWCSFMVYNICIIIHVEFYRHWHRNAYILNLWCIVYYLCTLHSCFFCIFI